MKTKLTTAMMGALTALSKKGNLTFGDLSAAGSNGASLANLVTHGLATRTDKGASKTWSITAEGREARKAGFYMKPEVKTAAPKKATTKPVAAKAKKSRGRKLAGVR